MCRRFRGLEDAASSRKTRVLPAAPRGPQAATVLPALLPVLLATRLPDPQGQGWVCWDVRSGCRFPAGLSGGSRAHPGAWRGAGSGLEVTGLLPHSSHTCTLWRALAVEPGLTAQVLGLLLEKVSRDVPFKETRAFLLSSSPGRVATVLPLAVSGAPGRT